MELIISNKANKEINKSKEYYNNQKDNLGYEFKNDVKNLPISIKKFPYIYPNVTNNIKRCLLHRFPFSIFYAIKNDFIIILSVAHQYKKPEF